MDTRAAKGGQTGVNGERYEGGQFLPSSPMTIKGEFKSSAKTVTHKQEIAPYTWEVAPTAGSRSIYRNLAGVFAKIINGKMVLVASEQTFTYYRMARETAQEMCNKWNSGERWF